MHSRWSRILGFLIAVLCFPSLLRGAVIIAEGERFTPLDTNGWQRTDMDHSFGSHTYGGMWMTHGACLGAPATSAGSVATQTVTVAAAGTYRVWSKYQAPPYFHCLHKLEVIQGGVAVYTNVYGRIDAPRFWSFAGAYGLPPIAQCWWPWGVDHDAAESPTKTVTLAAGTAILRLTTEANPSPAADRFVDFIVLTTTLGDTYAGYSPYGVGSPFCLEALATTELYFRFRNTTASATQLTVTRHGHFQPNYSSATTNVPASAVAAGAWSPWINIGPFCRLVHNEGLTLTLPGATGAFDVQFARDAAGLNSAGSATLSSGEAVNLPISITWDTNAVVRRSGDLAQDIIAQTDGWRKANGGVKPKQILFYGAFNGADSWIPELKDALGYNTLLPDTYDHVQRDGLYAHVYNESQIRNFAATLSADQKNRFLVLSFGDEISLGSFNFNDPAMQTVFHVWLITNGVTQADLGGVAPSQATLTDTGSPREVWYSNLFAHEQQFAVYSNMTAVAEAEIGPHVLTGANFSPHRLALYYGPVFQWIDLFKYNAMKMYWTEDYIFSVPEIPQIVSWMYATMRCAVKYHGQPMHFYAMPHAPGQTPANLRRNLLLGIGSGVRHIDNFWIAPQEYFTENYVAWERTDMFRTLHEAIYDTAEAESIQAGGTVRPARTAVVVSRATDFQESRSSLSKSNDLFLVQCQNAPATTEQILGRKDQQMIYLALRQAGHAVDLITEDDMVGGILTNYQVVYFAGEWIDTKVVAPLDAWVNRGGVLFATAGAGRFNQFGEIDAGMAQLLGISGSTVTKNVAVIRTLLELPLLAPIGTITMGGQSVSAVGLCQKFLPTTATVLGTWADGSAAVTRRDYGTGKAFAVGTLAGNSYMKTALPAQPWARGGLKNKFNPVSFDPAAAQLVRLGVDAAVIAEEVVCTEPLVEPVVIDNTNGTMVTLVNWTNGDLHNLTVTVRLAEPPRDVRSVAGQKSLPWTFANGQVTFTTDLADADYILLPKRGPNDLPVLTVSDVMLREGNSGSTNAVFTVTLSPLSFQTVAVNYSTAPGTAIAGTDYTATTGTLTFSPGTTSVAVAVSVLGDAVDEPDETFFLNLTNAVNAILADNQAVGTIIDDDGPPLARFSAAPTTGPAALPVVFLDYSHGTITNRFWNFGDGAATNTTADTVAHTYTVPGTYGVTLVVSGALGSSSTNRPNHITVLAPGRLTVSPGALDFGLVTSGDPSNLVFQLANTGDLSLVVTAALQNAGSPFTINPASPMTLAGSGATNLEVRFDPTQAGSFTNQVVFTGSGGASTNLVTGRGQVSIDLILDNASTNGVVVTGPWIAVSPGGTYGPDQLHDGNSNKGTMSVQFTPTFPVTTNYDVYVRWTANPNRAAAVPVDLVTGTGAGPVRVWLNQQLNDSQWFRVGTFRFAAGTDGSVAIRNEGTSAYVIADAVRWYATAAALPAAPSASPANLTATALAGNRIDLAWTDLSANETGFRIERSTDGATFATAGFAAADATVYSDTTALPGRQCFYRVRAYTAGGGDSAPSNVASATTINEIIVDNADPTGVAVAGSWTLAAPGGTYGPNQLTDGNAGKGTKSVTFTPTIPLTGNYEVYGRWTAFANRATNATFEVNHALGTATTWVNQQLNGGGWMLLGVFRFNAGTGGTVVIRNAGSDGYVVADAVRFYGTATALPSTPAAPSGLVASPVSGSQINLSWTDNATTEWGYKVERSTDNVTYTPIALVGAGATGYSDTGLSVATLYYYRVCAYNNAGNSGYSNVGNATTVLDYIVDNADPTGVLITGAWTVSAPGGTYGPNQIHDGNSGKGAKAVQFTPPLPAAGNYEVYARWTAQANRDPNVPIDVVHSYGTARVWVNQQLNGSVWVWLGTYRLEAGAVDNLTVRNDLTSGFVIADAARFTATANPLPVLPAAPSGLTATGAGSNRINLAWTDVATNELGYKIERSADGSSFSPIALVGSNSTSYGDSGLGGGLPYWYRVRAYNSRGDSGYSGVATASTLLEDIVDNLESNRVVYVGDWAVVAPGGTWGPNQVHDGGAGKGAKSVTFIPTAPVTGNYDLFARWTATSNRATNAPIDIAHANGTGRVWVNQQVNGGAWYKLGTYRFNAGTNGTVSVRNDGTEGWFVIADAVRILSTAASLPGLPGAPSGLTATTVASNRVELSWADGATNELGFKLERSVDSVNYQPLTPLGSNATSYADTGVTPGNAYWYRVRAYNAGGDSAWSAVASAQPLIEVIVDNLESNRVSYVGVWTVVAPGGTYGPNQVHDGNAGKATKSVTFAPAVASAGLYDVYVRWTASSNRATNAPVEVVHSNGVAIVWVNQQINGGVWFKVGTFRFNAGTNGTVAVRNDGTDGYVVADAVRLASSAATLPAGPAAPGGLVAAGSSGSAITLGWSDVATNELGYKIERSSDGVSFAPVAAVGSNVTGYVDGGRAPATTYTYRVRAYNGGGDSGYTGPASATVLTEVVVDNADGSGVTIVGSWTVAAPGGTWGPNQLHDGNAGKGAKSVRFTPTLAAGGTYQVYLRWTAYPNRAANVPVDITHASGTATVSVNQQINDRQWVLVGTYSFNAGSAGNVLVRTTGTTGYVVADAVRFVQTASPAPASAGVASAVPAETSRTAPSLGDATGTMSVADDGTIALAGSGLGIDQGSAYLAAQSVTGDFEMTARIESVTGPNESVAGLMLREGLDSNARFVALAGTLTEQYWAVWFRRAGESVQEFTPATSLSYPNAWVGLVRRGDTVSLHTSADGTSWIEDQSINIPNLSLTLEVGLFLSSGTPGVESQATVSQFRIDP